MALRLVMVEQVRAGMAFGQQQFTDEYQGVFLMAIGLVASEPDLSRPSLRKLRKTVELDCVNVENTFSMKFGERLTHSLHDHPLAGCTFFLSAIETSPQTVGRKVECDLTVPDTSVSELHCELCLVDMSTMFVTDLGSTNGTMINLQRLEPGSPTELEDEAILTIGRYSFQFFSAASLFNAMQVLEQSG
jgi:hypothetical protein